MFWLIISAFLVSPAFSQDQSDEVTTCSLTLVNGESTYTITKTEINVNVVATSAIKQGSCCYTLYTDKTRKRGDEQSITEQTTDIWLERIGSAYVDSCSVNSGEVLLYTMLGVGVLVILLAALGLVKAFSTVQHRRKERHRFNNMLINGSCELTEKFVRA